MEELQEIIKPYYLRRVKNDLKDMVSKTIKYLHYEMNDSEKKSYDELWDKYLALQEDKEKTERNKKLIEVSLMRQWLADKMIPKTISLVRKCIEKNHKVIIFCTYDNEINKFKEEFKDCCVYHNIRPYTSFIEIIPSTVFRRLSSSETEIFALSVRTVILTAAVPSTGLL